MTRNWVCSVAVVAVLAVAGVATANHLFRPVNANGWLPGLDANGSQDWNNAGSQKFTGVYTSFLGGNLVCSGKGNVWNDYCKPQVFKNSGLGQDVLWQLNYQGTTVVEGYYVQGVSASNKRQGNLWVADTFVGGFKNVTPFVFLPAR